MLACVATIVITEFTGKAISQNMRLLDSQMLYHTLTVYMFTWRISASNSEYIYTVNAKLCMVLAHPDLVCPHVPIV